MMGLGDLVNFSESVFASWLANNLGNLFPPANTKALQGDESTKVDDAVPEQPRTPKFKTFDAATDLAKLLAAVKDPVISVLIEDEPSTFYRLASLVLESRLTGEWFVCSRGRMSFEGNGGGIRNSRDILEQVKHSGAAIGVWVLPQTLLSDLDNGYATWMNVKPHAIPLLARVAQDYSWAEIERNVSKHV